MDLADRSKNQQQTPLLLPPAEDYLGQWLAVIGEHYPAGEMSPLAVLGYRASLGDLSPVELDLAFAWAQKHHGSGFRPTGPELRKYLHEARTNAPVNGSPALPEASLSNEEAAQVLADIRKQAASLPKDSGVVEITEEMREHHRLKTAEALKRFGKGAA